VDIPPVNTEQLVPPPGVDAFTVYSIVCEFYAFRLRFHLISHRFNAQDVKVDPRTFRVDPQVASEHHCC